ncbi:MAG: DUF4296 domain-containing protein [Bacteroidota bacterium]|jgi:hypothetical protein|nr:DUF4296 domain-containing protein [Bacteroidales bacterium]MDI9535717.1 DUF4296 domain-containing protein [Bacteroidota bacterium]NLP19669.1 DUF4296 domain-containing protein [Bacteroidales bacterium]HNY43839.1 DUF4296 domain-containing protein [Bacteroidales bacterium]HOD89007.1 DUF4296 domain-containing protein [Bacteroidales bacterium]
MNIKRFVYISVCALMLWSCAYKKTDKRFQQGENKVPKDTFELILYDVHLADAIVTSQIMKTKNNAFVDSLVYQSVFDKYGYTRQEFENTILYYVHNNMDTLHSICERTVNKFNLEKGNIH